jgi:hypothetical protein
MTIRYSGEVRTLTSDVVTSFAAVAQGRQPASEPLARGTVEIRPVNAKAPIEDGAFSVEVDEDPNSLSAFRMLVTTRLDDPCAGQREAAQAASREVQSARRDGASQRAIQRLEGELLARQGELDVCVERAGHTTGTTGRDLPVFRSRDLLRTSDGATRVDGLRLYWRVLDDTDRDALAEQGITLPFIITNAELTAMAQASAQPPVTIRRVRTERGRLRVDFHHEDHDVSGHVRIEVEPSASRTFTRLIEMQLIDFDTDGVKGELGELLDLIEWRLENAVEAVANRMNSQLAARFGEFTARGGTITLLGVSELDDGIHLSYAAGVLVNSPADPCQAIRDEIRFVEGQIHAAERDGVSDRGMAMLHEQLATARRRLDQCEETGSVPPPPSRPAPSRPRPAPTPAPVPAPTPTGPSRPRPDGPPRHEP